MLYEVITRLIAKAREAGNKAVFVLTTQTADWFERFGFIPAEISLLPAKRRSYNFV